MAAKQIFPVVLSYILNGINIAYKMCQNKIS